MVNWWKIKKFFQVNPKIWFLIIFLISFVFLFYLQYNSALADPDSFYHIKMSLILRDQGIVEEFPWLQYTVLSDGYTDQHWLYHGLMIPFVTFLHPVVGAKVFTVLLGATLITLFYWLLRKLHVRYAPIFTFLLLLVNPFIFRLSLIKAPVFSLIFLMVGLYLLFSYRHKALFVLSWLYVWSYGGFLLILVMSGLYCFISFVLTKRSTGYFKNFWRDRNVKLFSSSLAGVTLGVLLNPYFPQNLKFYWHQLVQIGIINYQDVIGVGGEWYPYKFSELIPNTIFVSLIMILAIIFFLINIKKQNRITITLFILSLFFFFLTLKSRRYVEYYVPFAVLCGAVIISRTLINQNIRKMAATLRQMYLKRKFFTSIIILYLIIVIPLVAIKDIRSNKISLDNGIPTTKFQAASQWLEENSQPGAIVLHSDWDEFPVLFYHNHHNYYIVGLDPTFMYNYDQALYWQWVNITIGEQKENLATIIKNDFRASFVFLEKDHTAMDANIEADNGFQLVYEDDQAKIYEVI